MPTPQCLKTQPSPVGPSFKGRGFEADEASILVAAPPWGVDGPPGATGVLSGRGGRKRGSPIRSNNEVIHLIQGCHCALLQKLCKMPKSQTLDP